MFVYSNATKDKIYINVASNKPLNTPDYSLDIVDGVLYVNGQVVNKYETIELAPNQEFDTAYEVNEPTYININDTVITCPNDTVGDGVFHVVNNGVLTISGNGKINSVGNNDYCMAIWADGGKVVINGGTYTNVGAGDHDHYDLLYVKNGGILEINGGYFECQTPRWTLNSNNTAPGTIIVKGGTFVGYNPAKSYTDENGTDFTNFVADGYTVKQEGNLFTVYKK